jgi:hypothetical protein
LYSENIPGTLFYLRLELPKYRTAAESKTAFSISNETLGNETTRPSGTQAIV